MRSRRRRAREPANHERWLISYADFITLLFAFFVVMFASSQADKGKQEQMSEAVKSALEGKHVSQVIAAILGGAADNQGKGSAQNKGPAGMPPPPDLAEVKKKIAEAELTPSYNVLTQELSKEIEAGQITVSMQSRGLVVSFAQAALFPSGNDVISGAALKGLEKVDGAISKISNPVRLEGHTDARRIKTSRFKSNWELSAARSIALLEILSTKFGLPRSRMSIAGYADTAPVAANDSEEGRARNRRVDIVLLNEQAQLAEPKKEAAIPVPVPEPEPPLRPKAAERRTKAGAP